jgi:hypothetical protein
MYRHLLIISLDALERGIQIRVVNFRGRHSGFYRDDNILESCEDMRTLSALG